MQTLYFAPTNSPTTHTHKKMSTGLPQDLLFFPQYKKENKEERKGHSVKNMNLFSVFLQQACKHVLYKEILVHLCYD